MYVEPVGIFVPSACVYYIYANVLALYVPGVGRITRYKSRLCTYFPLSVLLYPIASVFLTFPVALGHILFISVMLSAASPKRAIQPELYV